MAVNSGLPKRISYSAYNTDTREMVSGDQGNHTLNLILDGVPLGAPTNNPISVGYGVYEIDLTEAERTGVDLLLTGESSTANVLLMQNQFSADGRWNELLELDGDNLRGTSKYLEQAPDSVADVSLLALEASVQGVLSTGGTGPWTYGVADISLLALEASVQEVLTTGGTGPWTYGVADVSLLALEASVQQVLTTGGTGPWTTGSGGGGEADWTETERSQIRKRLGIDGATDVPAAAPDLALEASLQTVMDVTDKFTFNGSDIPIVDTQWWQGGEMSGVQMIEDLAGSPRWTIRALSQAPAGGAGGTVTYVSRLVEEQGGFYEIYRGDTLRFPLLLDMSLVSYEEIILSIKRDSNDLDTEALLYISSATGLKYINGEVAETEANGSLLVDSSATGVILTTCAAEEMAKLPELKRGAIIEVQVKTASSVYTPWRRKVSIIGDIVRAV